MNTKQMNKAQAAGAQVVQHTPVPWVSQMGVGCGILYNIGPADARPVLGVFHAPDKKQPILIANANAEFIVKACNCHEEMLEALKECRPWVRRWSGASGLLAMVDNVVAKAEGKL